MASPSAGALALKYGDVNTVTPSPGEAKGLNNLVWFTLSYAVFKSINSKYLVYLLLVFLISNTLCLNFNKFNSVPHPLINPICFLFNFLSFTSFNNLVNNADSIILSILLDIAIGLRLLASPVSFAFLFKQNKLHV